MNKLFIESDIFLDVLLNREKFSEHSSKIFDLSIANSHHLCTSAICISNIYYMCSSMIGKEKTRQNLQIVKPLFKILETSDLAVEQALNSKFSDLEDAFQYYTALEGSVDIIITRNIKDFKLSEIPVLTPTEFLATLN